MESDNKDKKLILTEEEANLIKNQVEQLRAQLYRTDFKLNEYIDKNFTESQKEFILREINPDATVGETERAIDRVLQSISSMESMLIKLSFDPTVSFVNWFKEFLCNKTQPGVNLIIKIETDKSMIAGMLLEFKGKIKSNTVKNEILNIFSTI